MGRKIGAIWAISKGDLSELVRNSRTLSAVIRSLGLTTKGTTNFRSLKRRFECDSIDFAHISLGRASNKGRKFGPLPKIPLDQILVQKSTYSRTNLKVRLIRDGVFEYKCARCGLSEWLGQPISLQLDHINGVADDHRLVNLRLLCPNCHSQTDNFGGKCLKKSKPPSMKRGRKRKIEWPSKEELKAMLWSMPTTHIASKYGVSDKAVTKWAKAYQLDKPPRGYWAKNGPVV